jgi:hypothetical protein
LGDGLTRSLGHYRESGLGIEVSMTRQHLHGLAVGCARYDLTPYQVKASLMGKARNPAQFMIKAVVAAPGWRYSPPSGGRTCSDV